jgi:hypothetical protein
VQREEEITLSQNPEAQVQPDLHDSSSSPSARDGTISPPHGDLDLPIALRKQSRTTVGKLPSNLSQYDPLIMFHIHLWAPNTKHS